MWHSTSDARARRDARFTAHQAQWQARRWGIFTKGVSPYPDPALDLKGAPSDPDRDRICRDSVIMTTTSRR